MYVEKFSLHNTHSRYHAAATCQRAAVLMRLGENALWEILPFPTALEKETGVIIMHPTHSFSCSISHCMKLPNTGILNFFLIVGHSESTTVR